MADKKISALTAATTPLAGTEVLPIVQSGATVKVAVSDLTAGRSVAMQDLTIASTSGSGLLSVTRTGIAGLVFAADGSGPLIWPTTVDNIQIYNKAITTQIFALNTSNGNLTAQTGNFVVGTSGKGIDFSATPGTGTSELLNDYEEGTFTATLTASTTAPTTPVTATAYYTVVGRLVTVQVGFFNVDTTGAVGSVEITGMPFTAASTFSIGSAAVDFGASSPVSFINSGATKILLYASNTLGGIPIVGSAGRFVVASISYLK